MKISNTSTVVTNDDSSNRYVRGQSLTEYIIILSLVAIAAISAASFFGDTVKASFVALGSELTGAAKYDTQGQTAASLKKAQTGVTTQTTLGNYRD